MRKMIIAGNWKMNNTAAEARELITALKPLLKGAKAEVVVCPPFTALAEAKKLLRGSRIRLGAQNMHDMPSGAYTGEVSAPMLKEHNVSYVIIGHSERRQYFAETDASVNAKAKAALNAGLVPIICVGEDLDGREAGKTDSIVCNQVHLALAGLENDAVTKAVIAYEPIWAIGTGKTATAEEAERVCALIRKQIAKDHGRAVSNRVRILYGGSMNARNAKELKQMPNIDGGLIGGASLKPMDFSIVVND
ncbi:MAG: triose-phosphate isomerase [Bacillota bacterium]|nr:triose-phosphate isomerase [Bacillota bacterium]